MYTSDLATTSYGACIESTGTPTSMTSAPRPEIYSATVPPPPWSMRPSSPICHWHVVLVEQTADFSGIFGGSIVGTALAAGTGVFHHADAIVDIAAVVGFISGSIGRIIGCADVCGQAFGMAHYIAHGHAIQIGQILDKVAQEIGIEARIAHRTDFFLIGQHGDNRGFRRATVESGHHGRIGADAVIVAIGTDQAAVKADIGSLGAGNKFNFGGHQIAFGDAVFIVKGFEHIQLKAVFAFFTANRAAAYQDIEVFTGNTRSQGFGHLFLSQMRQQVRYTELGIGRLIVFCRFLLPHRCRPLWKQRRAWRAA